MTSLQEVQESLQNFLLFENINPVKCYIDATETLPAESRLNIYGNAYILRLTEALATNYPFLKSCLGESSFNTLAINYIQKYPSQYRSIRWFGDNLSEFMKNQIEYQSSYYLYEIAKLEWILTLVFDAKDRAIFSLDDMTSIDPADWPDIKFKFHPSVRQDEFKWNIVEFWQSCLNQEKPISLKEYHEPISWIFWRKDLMNHFHSLSKHESWALNVAMAGATFGEICEGLCQYMNESDVGTTAASVLKNWIASGLISNIFIPPTGEFTYES